MPYVRPRRRGPGYAARRIGEAQNPGPPWENFWAPLLSGRVGRQTLQLRYRPAVARFLEFVQSYGEPVETAADCEYWLAFYLHTMYITGGASFGTAFVTAELLAP